MSTIIVLAKEPRAGRVKTRLCPPCTPAGAALVAEAALRDTLDAVAGAGADRVVVVLDGTRPEWFPDELEVIPQRTGGLDVRLADAFDDVLGASPVNEPAVLIAMDTPQVSAAQLREALGSLHESSDAVLGLTSDGGYWIIGLCRNNRRVFEGVPMSTGATGVAQRERLDSLYYRTTMVEPVFDIDLGADLDRLVVEHPHLRTSNVWNALRLSN